MARKKKDDDKAPKEPARPTIEQLSDEDRLALTMQHKATYQQRLAAKKKADADFKNACKMAKAELGPGGVDEIKMMIDLETEEGEARLRNKLESQIRVARWVGASLGTQFDMGFEAAAPGSDTDRAMHEGRQAAVDIKPRKPPEKYAHGSPGYEFWLKGYDNQSMSTIGRGKIGDQPASHQQQ